MAEKTKKNLTLRYSVTQFTYWAASTGAASFATIYLLDRGMSSAVIGTLLAVSGILACASQPLLASIADRSDRFLLKKMLLLITTFCVLCYLVQLLDGMPLLLSGGVYVLSICASDACVPLLNAFSVAYSQAGYEINYSAARGVGSVASATASLILGTIFARYGAAWMILFLLGFRLLSMVLIAGFPRIRKKKDKEKKEEKSCTIHGFFLQYRWYCVSLLAILLLGMYHAMTENYMIAVMQRLGGNSGQVGKALFISSMAGAPVIFFYSTIRTKISDQKLLKIAAVSFLIKAVGFCFAPSILTIYALQLLQISSYGFLGPAQVYYARSKVRSCDMVKGQAFIAAAYALGCALGNFAGGQMLRYGVSVMLTAGVGMALAGTVVMFLTVEKKDMKNK